MAVITRLTLAAIPGRAHGGFSAKVEAVAEASRGGRSKRNRMRRIK